MIDEAMECPFPDPRTTKTPEDNEWTAVCNEAMECPFPGVRTTKTPEDTRGTLNV